MAELEQNPATSPPARGRSSAAEEANNSHSKPSFSARRKWTIGMNVGAIVLVVLAVVVMVNYLSQDYFKRFHLSALSKHELSPLTLKFLKSFTNEVKVTLYYDQNDQLYE